MKQLVTYIALLFASPSLADDLIHHYIDPASPWKSSHTVTFPKFDPQLGTLRDVDIRVSTGAMWTYSGLNLTSGSNEITVSPSGWADFTAHTGDNLGRQTFTGSYTRTLNPFEMVSDLFMGGTSLIRPTASLKHLGLSSFIGTGTIAFKMEYFMEYGLTASGGPNSFTGGITSVNSISATLYYTYDLLNLVSGVVTFEGLSDEGVRPANALFEFRLAGTQTVISTALVPIGADGSFSVSAPSQALYEMAVKPSHWLRKRVVVDVTSGEASGVQISLTNGDCNNDNSVDLLDYFALSDSYNLSSSDVGFASNADLNGDLSVDLLDYFILSDNYLLEGDAA